ncbi:aliphatic sulfonate ABC transporter substrate-binding protein [Acinetobacter sp. 194]|uniref:aliphatic sulfonate ABC transporter substrate-binding protein n=1 Tax=Acinetobacter shaoyimingii TaxID=2715164 RepID=UPI00140CBCBD|nr:aliphatic sulfonate ABC transporter substrate-binding protein [Acinetobacter shaoyimingii]NHB57986.1 aliphatic sulfonate ABC transporter substrate-binding protein [Acinetobacter shaoyimingii]
MKKVFAAAVTLGLSLSLISCTKTENIESEKEDSEKPTEALKTFNIGYQKAALKFIVAKKNKSFEQAFPETKVEWKEFPAGPQTLEALNVGAIDVGYTGDTPVIFALSANKPIKYLGYEINSKNAHSLLLPKDSPIKDVKELKGKRIAVTQGSSAHFFLSQVLDQAQLTWQDIQPIWLTPADARAAIDKKSVDAWAIWDPYASAASLKGDTRVLTDATHVPPAYSFYSSTDNFLQSHPAEAKKFIETLNETDAWINAHPDETAQILAESTGIELEVAKLVIEKRRNPAQVNLLNAETVDAQQKIADLFFNLKLIPNAVQIKDNFWNGQ